LTTALRQAIQNLVVANRILAHENVVDGFGHITMRHPERPDRYLMARSRSPQLVCAEDILEFRLDDEPVEQDGRALYSERAIHGAVYRARSDVQSVCHNHSQTVIPFGIAGVELRPVLHSASVIGERVPIWDIREEFGDTDLLVTTHEKGDSLARALGARRALLMRGHGAVIAGAGLRDAVFTAVYLQVNAHLILQARVLGESQYLSAGEVECACRTHLSPLSQNRAWEYWSSRAGFPAPAAEAGGGRQLLVRAQASIQETEI
jgi:HCOMODA/2-hydroxy-3-carboxy-muconic semialdehyde decarboxylase